MPTRIEFDKQEELRTQHQVRLDALMTASERNRSGQFATPPSLALEIARYSVTLCAQGRRSIRFFEPALGSGAFYSALRRCVPAKAIESARGIELNEALASTAKELWESSGLEVINADFTRMTPSASDRANLIITNPPYVRHHHLDQGDKARLRGIASTIIQRNVSGLSGLYCYFLILADRWLSQNGIGVWLIPSEFMDVNYGEAVKEYLSRHVSLIRLHRFDPQEVQFDDALVSSAVVVYRKALPAEDHTVECSFGGSLLEPRHQRVVSPKVLSNTRKWTTLLDASGNGSACGDAAPSFEPTLSSLFSVTRGIATGANDFFILERNEAASLCIANRFLKPILPSPRYVKDAIIDADEDGYPVVERQLALIDSDLPEALLRKACPPLWEYLEAGEARGIRNAYLIAKRTPWYRQEQREPAPFLCTYMGRSEKHLRPFRFIWNRSRAIAPNVYLLLYPKGPLKRAVEEEPDLMNQVFEFLESIEPDALITEGRVYGGGLYKLEPKELLRISAKRLIERLNLDLGSEHTQRRFEFAATGP